MLQSMSGVLCVLQEVVSCIYWQLVQLHPSTIFVWQSWYALMAIHVLNVMQASQRSDTDAIWFGIATAHCEAARPLFSKKEVGPPVAT